MSKSEVITLKGTIVDCLPNATFRVKLDESGIIIFGFISGKIRKYNINVILGDEVLVEMSDYDLTKGRIVFRSRSDK